MSVVPQLAGFEIRCSPTMAGQSKCVKLGGVIHVSPAQWDLLKNARGDELKHLLENLPMLDMDGKPAPCHRCQGDGVEVIGCKVATCTVCKGEQVIFPHQRFDFTTRATP